MDYKLDKILSEVLEVVVSNAIPNSYEYKLEIRNIISDKYRRTTSMEEFGDSLLRNILFFSRRINLYSDYIYHWFQKGVFPSQEELLRVDEHIRHQSLEQIDGVWSNDLRVISDHYTRMVPMQKRISALEDAYAAYSTQHALMIDFCNTLVRNPSIIRNLSTFQPGDVVETIKSLLVLHANLTLGNVEIELPTSNQQVQSSSSRQYEDAKPRQIKKTTDKIGNYYSNIFDWSNARYAETERYVVSCVSRNGISGLYRNTKGKDDHVCLIEGSFNCINVVEDWIYFYDLNDGIWRIKIDGSTKELIDKEYAEHFIVVNDWIYYIRSHNKGIFTNSFTTVLYKIKTNGTSKQEIDVLSSKTQSQGNTKIAYWDGFIYFRGNAGIWRIKTDRTGKERIIDINSSYNWVFQDGYHYVQISTELFRFDSNGGNKKLIIQHPKDITVNYHINEKHIVWADMIDRETQAYSIFQTDISGGEIREIETRPGLISGINILKDGLYYLYNNSYYFIPLQ